MSASQVFAYKPPRRTHFNLQPPDHKLILCKHIPTIRGWLRCRNLRKPTPLRFRQHLELPNAIPGHENFKRVYHRIDPLGFQDGLMRWT